MGAELSDGSCGAGDTGDVGVANVCTTGILKMEKLIKLKEKLEAKIKCEENSENLKLLLKGIKWKIMISEFQKAITKISQ